MCGIAGFHNTQMNKEGRIRAILSMNERMVHRGPDADGFFVALADDCLIGDSTGRTEETGIIPSDNGMVLGHRRLSIQDLSKAGAQPIISHDKHLVMVYNGEIYNASQIRADLEKDKGQIVWRGTSDSEVLLEAIDAYGLDKALKMTKGMFALAVYDLTTGSMSLARDRVGEKPLYYGHVHGDLVFASDIDVIRAYPGFDNAIDKEALALYIRYGFIPAPKSVYENIYKLTPGTILTYKPPYTAAEETIYYDLASEYSYGATEGRFKGSFDEAVDGLENVLREAVKSQLVSDVPIGAFLSGGIDSSVCVALMQSVSSSPVKTFTIGFEDKKYDESEAAAAISRHLGTEHTCLTVSEKELIDVVPKISDIFTEPFADSSQIPTYLVSRIARSKVTVSLSGDAGDELFAGYNTYWKVADLYDKLRRFPAGLRHFAGRFGLGSSNNTLYRAANCLMADDIANLHEAVCYNMTQMSEVPSLHNVNAVQDMMLHREIESNDASIMDEMMLRDMLRYHPDDILVKVDRAGMAVSLENRVPMLDKDVLKFAFSLPAGYKLSHTEGGNLINKHILREVLYRYVPKELMDRPKKGFSVPLVSWLTSGQVHDMAWSILTDSKLVSDGYLDKQWLNGLMKRFVNKGENASLLWSVFILEQWYRKYHGSR